jgi:hypothetical protein
MRLVINRPGVVFESLVPRDVPGLEELARNAVRACVAHGGSLSPPVYLQIEWEPADNMGDSFGILSVLFLALADHVDRALTAQTKGGLS